MRRALLLIAGPACVGAAFFVAWLFELSFEHVVLLAPVIVFGTAAVVGLVVLWARALLENVRGR
jgi:nitrate reductase gamma subunit